MAGLYLARKDATNTNDDQDVEDRWAHDGADPHVSFSDEHTWDEKRGVGGAVGDNYILVDETNGYLNVFYTLM